MKILSIVGARPQFVKAAAISRAIRCVPGLEEVLVHTGQHLDANMSQVFFEELEIPEPHHNLAISGGGHGEMTGRMLEALERTALLEKPDYVLVFGDTNSTLAGALAAAKLHIPVAHVEAGLRSHNRRMPEEVNRILTDHVGTVLLCPTLRAVENLAAEGITHGVHHVGDVMYDVMLHAIKGLQAKHNSDVLERLSVNENGYFVATVHRAENTDDPAQLAKILTYLKSRAAEHPVVFPIHPRTRDAVTRSRLDLNGLTVCEPVSYLDMTLLLAGAVGVLTDSGGLQKEAYFHRTPCVTLRDETEWVETIECGWNRLWSQPNFAEPRCDIPEYGDGKTADRIVSIIVDRFGKSSRPTT
ncbi:MAG: UDP-N-acetylglucosamine 2-epimerase (non-hydrolyzing) [Gammaproteobacteria bacterium]|nr:UDP-N-acetylglucosamine 2-epimerase (non-hydrolyzing) [Gammaproteobacteria bacterium]